MFPSIAAMSMSNSPSLSADEAAASSSTLSSAGLDHFACLNPLDHHHPSPPPPHKIKKKRSLPGNPDPDAEVIALSPKTLLATNRFVCEICNKGFQRDQNLQLHRRGHNLPWKLKQRSSKDLIKKRAYVCPEPSCVHHHPSRALGDLTGIKKHFCRKHGEKKWKCDKCSKIYAVQSDWKAHSKTCGTREYRCDCGTLFSRKDSFITHRAFCDALAEESARISASQLAIAAASATSHQISLFPPFPGNNHPFITNPPPPPFPFTTSWGPPQNPNPNTTTQNPVLLHHRHIIKPEEEFPLNPTLFQADTPPALPPPHDHQHKQQPADQFITSPSCFRHLHVSTHPTFAATTLSATALLQKAATMGASSAAAGSQSAGLAELAGFMSGDQLATWQKTDRLTRDFLGLTSADNDGHGCDHNGNGDVNVVVVKDMLTYAGGPIEFQQYHNHHDQLRLHGHHHALLKPQGFGFAEIADEQQI